MASCAAGPATATARPPVSIELALMRIGVALLAGVRSVRELAGAVPGRLAVTARTGDGLVRTAQWEQRAGVGLETEFRWEESLLVVAFQATGGTRELAAVRIFVTRDARLRGSSGEALPELRRRVFGRVAIRARRRTVRRGQRKPGGVMPLGTHSPHRHGKVWIRLGMAIGTRVARLDADLHRERLDETLAVRRFVACGAVPSIRKRRPPPTRRRVQSTVARGTPEIRVRPLEREREVAMVRGAHPNDRERVRVVARGAVSGLAQTHAIGIRTRTVVRVRMALSARAHGGPRRARGPSALRTVTVLARDRGMRPLQRKPDVVRELRRELERKILTVTLRAVRAQRAAMRIVVARNTVLSQSEEAHRAVLQRLGIRVLVTGNARQRIVHPVQIERRDVTVVVRVPIRHAHPRERMVARERNVIADVLDVAVPAVPGEGAPDRPVNPLGLFELSTDDLVARDARRGEIAFSITVTRGTSDDAAQLVHDRVHGTQRPW